MLKKVILDKIKWRIDERVGKSVAKPLCPIHELELEPKSYIGQPEITAKKLYCEDCNKSYQIPRGLLKQKRYVLNKVGSKELSRINSINLDGEVIPLTKFKLKQNQYWLEAKMIKSKAGAKLVIYAGDKNRKNKTQIFVDPGVKRFGFDQSDHHPTDIFTKIEITFEDGSKHTIKK